MSRRQIVTIAGAVAIAVALATGGYVLGSTSAPDQRDADSAHHDAAHQAFADARDEALRAGQKRGRVAGAAAGLSQGARQGAKGGVGAGRADVRDQVHTLQLAAQKRSESESEIGGVDSLGGAGPLDGAGGVLVVGDSLEVLTIPYLKQYLSGVKVTTNAVGGYNSFQIFDLFKESYDPSQSVIVFDSGTNDNPNYPEILAGRLKAVSEEIGDRCMVVPSIHGLTVGGVGNAGKNQTVSAFVASRPGTQSPDWAGAVSAHPELMQSDDLHPIAAGADLRARLIAQGVKRCLQFG
ncbi:hypothetical protein BH10ACT11_BH10ACT11_14140 [soil metagenome]